MNEQPTKGLYIVHEICLREQKRTESVCSETGRFPGAAADDIIATMVLLFKMSITFRCYQSASSKFVSID